MRFGRIDPGDPAVADLIAAHAAHNDAHYPADSNHHQDGAALAAEGTVLFAAHLNGQVVAMAGYKPIAARHGEVKSMHVLPVARGRGIAARMLEMVLEHAQEAGFERLSLETGSSEASAAARRLYMRAGFEFCDPFGTYVEDPESVFMTRGCG